MIHNPSNYRVNGTTMTFIEIYPTFQDFQQDYNTLNLTAVPFKNPDFLRTVYTILIGEYANSRTTNSSLDLFRARFMTRLMSYGPQFERELEIQAELLAMPKEELMKSSEVLYNTGRNPSKAPPTNAREPLNFIDAQSAMIHSRSRLDAYAYLFSLLNGDITLTFIKRFDDLFRPVLWGNEAFGYEPIEYEGDYTV